MTPTGTSKGREEVRDEAQALAREMAHDILEFTRVGWKLAGQVGRLALHAAEDMANEAEKTWERRKPSRGRGK
ncbi:MAG: hypothetical protein KGJ23_09445 [Euryarchaeota archaeon]|nr:hypothetical protein [Euryarchaeota archaeon]MDE1836827.1 hypothetical protein [Euryarchaeota archaeon]MDE1881730.1 hypothetical protein [Euryarchaeota archaeon]MDE2044811.1 hypothetical protein [Thermoplasmata archaeon]